MPKKTGAYHQPLLFLLRILIVILLNVCAAAAAGLFGAHLPLPPRYIHY